jgi:phage terminase large subunit
MMGFWQKMFSGKPVFDEDDQEQDAKTLTTPVNIKSAFVDQHGKKIIPEISFRNFKSHSNGSKVTSWAWVENLSEFEVELEKIELLSYHAHIGRRLKPHEGHEVMVYDGVTIQHDHDHHVRVYFTIHENDDLFLAEYTIEFNRESNGMFTLEEFHREHQARDV